MFFRFAHILCVFGLLLGGAEACAQQLQLVMLEREDCPWCRAWHREIGPAYPLTTEGRQAPLRRVDLARSWPADLPKLAAYYTPTFVLLACGQEVGRLVGYQGEHFFYPALGQLLSTRPGPTAC